ncbi:MAG: hypothetical protein ACYSWU_11080 [Planctomycetota bacterium]|jgi:hypothetical protein
MNPLLEEHNDWRMITSVLTDVLDAQFGVTVLPSFSASQVRPVIENVSAEQYRLVIPIGDEAGKPVVAVGTLTATPGEILEKLLGLAVRHVRQGRKLEEQRLDLDAYAQQVSRDFEELTWLRGLLQRLKHCDETAAAEDLARTVLLPLCSLTGAEQIILVSASRRGNNPNGPPERQQSGSSDEDVPPVGKVVVRVGPEEQVVDDRNCCKLVDRLREVVSGQSLIQTGMKKRREFSMVPDVDSCIIVPVTRQESLLGWILAVNRSPTTIQRHAPADQAVSSLAENEFGSFEANLLDFAAVVLAAHPCCAELFEEGAAVEQECLASN